MIHQLIRRLWPLIGPRAAAEPEPRGLDHTTGCDPRSTPQAPHVSDGVDRPASSRLRDLDWVYETLADARLPEVVCSNDLALVLRCAPCTARRWIRSGRLGRVVRVGGHIAVMRSSLERAVARLADFDDAPWDLSEEDARA